MNESKRQLLLISSNWIGGNNTQLQHVENDIKDFLKSNRVKTVLFLPYAKKNYDKVTNITSRLFSSWNFQIESIHNAKDPIEAVRQAEAIYIGGGNTFVLLKTLYDKNLIDAIRKRVLDDGIPYIGTSAGANVATRSIHTTNDMPVVYPPSFDALNLIPFNINPHYIKLSVLEKMAANGKETRDARIKEFISYSNLPVLGLRDENCLKVSGNTVKLAGNGSSRYFSADYQVTEYQSGADLSFLIGETTRNNDVIAADSNEYKSA